MTVRIDPHAFQVTVNKLKTRVGKLNGAAVQAGFVPDGQTQLGPAFPSKQHADNPFEMVVMYAIYNSTFGSQKPCQSLFQQGVEAL